MKTTTNKSLKTREKHHRVLLHVEDHRQIRPAEENQGHGGREQTEAGLRAGLHQQDDQVCPIQAT